ncbi:hypothetical protein HRbin36_02282 [bacterium HR36]|nr:hypothetical protein HRbin36_02282 [bacterium HR36]
MRLHQVESPPLRLACQHEIICVGIVTPQREFQAAFTRHSSVAGARVAARAREHGQYFVAKTWPHFLHPAHYDGQA